MVTLWSDAVLEVYCAISPVALDVDFELSLVDGDLAQSLRCCSGSNAGRVRGFSSAVSIAGRRRLGRLGFPE